MDSQQEPIGKKLPLEFFCEKFFCNSNGFFIQSDFIFFCYILLFLWDPSQKVSFI